MSLTPIQTQERLDDIDRQLALAANELDELALAWFRAKRDREVEKSTAYAEASGPATERKIVADAAAALIGVDEEAHWEARKLLVRLLESRSNIGMALLKSYGRS